MPFVSDKQRSYLWANKPNVARKFANHNDGTSGVMENKMLKEFTEKDRYGNSKTYKFEVPQSEAPIDRTALAKHAIDKATEMEVPPMMMDLELNDGIPEVPQSYDEALLHSREGYRDDVYLDSLGKPTVGAGHLLPDSYIGKVGEQPFSPSQLKAFFNEDLMKARENARANIPSFDQLNRKQQGALTSMAFQLGKTGQSKFKNMIEAIESGNFQDVGMHAADSKWASQTPRRVQDIQEAFYQDGTEEVSPIDLIFPESWNQYSEDDDIWAAPSNPVLQDDSTTYVPPPEPYNFPTPPNQHLHEDVQAGEEGYVEPDPLDVEVPELSTVPYDVEGEEDEATYIDTNVNDNLLRQRKFDVEQTDKKIAVAEKNLASVDPAANPKKYNKYFQDLENLKAEKAGYASELSELEKAKGLQTQIAEQKAAEADKIRQIHLESQDTLSPAEQAELDGLNTEVNEEEAIANLSEDPEAAVAGSQVTQESMGAAQEAVTNMSPEEKNGILEQAKGILGDLGGTFGFDQQDLNRFLLYSAAGYLTGGSFQGSLKWAGLQVLNENQARKAAEAKAANKGVNLSQPKNFEVDGKLVRASWDKSSGQYVYQDKGQWKALPESAIDPNVKFEDLGDIQSDFDKDIESSLNSINANVAEGEERLTVDSRAISAEATNIFQNMKENYGRTTGGSKELQRKISEAVREVVKRGGNSSELRAEVNKKLLKIRVGVSENAIAKTDTENFATLDGILEQESTDAADYKADWQLAHTTWSKLPKKTRDKWSKEPGWDGFTWFTYQVLTGNRDALDDAKGIKT